MRILTWTAIAVQDIDTTDVVLCGTIVDFTTRVESRVTTGGILSGGTSSADVPTTDERTFDDDTFVDGLYDGVSCEEGGSVDAL